MRRDALANSIENDESSCWSSGTSASESLSSVASSSYTSSSSPELLKLLFAVRRRGTTTLGGLETGTTSDVSSDSPKQRSYSRNINNNGIDSTRRHRRRIFQQSKLRKMMTSRCCGRLSTGLFCCGLALCIVMVLVQQNRMLFETSPRPGMPIRQRTKLRTERNRQQHESVVTRMNNRVREILGFQTNNKKRKTAPIEFRQNSESLPPSCYRPEWQELSFPNCNEMHEVDLGAILLRSAPETSDSVMPWTGYVASGLWRSVWAVDPRAIANDVAVLKMMKREHEVNQRNFDRHRRDALVMERLTKSPYVVNNYAYCGNSVLTEFIDTNLEDLITADRGKIGTNWTDITGAMRIQWALDVARGVQALHEFPDGPIVHADLQSSQFLLSSQTGRVKVNDFNRCRFMARNNETEIPCKFRIPSAPGKVRSPEEYSYKELDEKLDIYSLGNILYSLWTKNDVWEYTSAVEAKRMIEEGRIPDMEIAVPFLSTNAAFLSSSMYNDILLNLTRRAFVLNPDERISAAELASTLEKLVESL